MIIEKLLSAIYELFSSLTQSINIPPLPDDIMQFLEQVQSYFDVGLSILAIFTPLSFLLVLLGIIIVIDIAIGIYHLVLWILKKIPMAGIS